MTTRYDCETCTSLSPGVRRLITETGVCDGDEENNCITECGLKDWDKLKEILPKVPNAKDEEYFKTCVHLLAPMFRDAEKTMGRSTSKQKFVELVLPLMKWTGSEKTLEQCFDLLHGGDAVDVQLSMLVLTSVLERGLGDIYLMKAPQCPSMLKDLLVTQELQDLLGTTVIQLLRIVIGPPISLNLRNVVWHGFPLPGEIPDRYGWFLLQLIPSIGEALRARNITDIAHRAPVEFAMIQVCQTVFTSNDLSGALPHMMNLLENTTIVPAYRRPVWKSVLQLYSYQRFGLCATLLLPELEHTLRGIFSKVNNCPERVLTAEATTLYTTFDEILDPLLENGEENKFADEVGEACMNMLLDILEYPAGPRIRDRLSHGQVDLWSFPPVLCNVLLTTVMCIAARYVPPEILSELQSQCLDLGSILKKRRAYQSLFHPIALVKQKIETLVSSAAEINKSIHYTFQLEDRNSYSYQELCREDHHQLVHIQTLVADIVVSIFRQWSDVDISQDDVLSRFLQPMIDGRELIQTVLLKESRTLYRFHKSREQYKQSPGQNMAGRRSEMVNLLLRILMECQTVVSQIQTTLQTKQHQYGQGQLSTRQTDSLHKLITCCPSMHLTVHMICLVVAWQLYNMDTQLDDLHCKITLRFSKSLLKHCENMRTFTAPDKHRWTECLDTTVIFLQKLQIFIEQL